MNRLVAISTPPKLPMLVTAAGERAGIRFLEFFAANVRNPHTRRAYTRAAEEFLAWRVERPCRRSAPCNRFTSRPGSRPTLTSSAITSFRATGTTVYLKNGGTLEKAPAMASHTSTRTTPLYDRRCDELSLDEVEGIVV
jgi:hypothetical protein